MISGMTIDVTFDKLKNTSFWEQYMLNSFQFSAAKSASEMKFLQSLLFDENKQKRSYPEFRKLAEPYQTQFDHWFRVEYDLASRGSILAEQWQRIWRDRDINPYMIYHTRRDSRVRPEHAEHDGLILPIDDMKAQLLYPPLDWNCFEKGTLIKTILGWRKIDDLNIGDSIIGGSNNICIINAIHINVCKDKLFRIITKRGFSSCTNNHRILTVKGWKRADEINVFDIIIDATKNTFTNAIICYIKNCYAFSCYKLMSFIIKRQTIMSKTFNSNINIREKNINPIWTNIMIKNNIISKLVKMIYSKLLIFSRFNLCVEMFRWFDKINMFFCNNRFFYNIRPKKRRRHFKFGGNIRKFFAEIRMWNFRNIITKSFALFLFPFFCIYPLALYCIASVSDWYIKIIEKHRNNSIVSKIPAFTKFSKSIKLNRIKFVQNNGSGAPLDRFNSNYAFLYNMFIHNKFNLVTDVKTTKYNDNVYNLSIENDETYITKIGIVHNCRCSVSTTYKGNPASQEQIEKALKTVPEEFQHNVGIDGIMPSKKHSYFDVVQSANDFSFKNFGEAKFGFNPDNYITLNNKIYDFYDIKLAVNDWYKQSQTTDHKDILFRNREWKLNVRMTQESLHKLGKRAKGFENIKKAIEQPTELWGKWVDPKNQREVIMTYILRDESKNAYFVETKGGIIQSAYYRQHNDSKDLRRLGVKFIK